MKVNHRAERDQHLRENIPDAFSYKTVLYIGAKVKKRWPKGMDFVNRFLEAGYKIDVLEAWPINVADLHHFNDYGRTFKDDIFIKPGTFRKIIYGDARKIGKYITDKYDVVMFWHGPEHLTPEDVPTTLRKLENFAAQLVIIGCPYGKYQQKEAGGNKYEKHHSAIYPEFFLKIGWEFAELGERDVRTANLLAWKRTNYG